MVRYTRRSVPIVSFAVGSAVGAGLVLPGARSVLPNPAKSVLAIETILLLSAAVPPISSRSMTVTFVLSLAAGVQMAVFTRVRGWSYSTTVTTNNITKWDFGGRSCSGE